MAERAAGEDSLVAPAAPGHGDVYRDPFSPEFWRGAGSAANAPAAEPTQAPTSGPGAGSSVALPDGGSPVTEEAGPISAADGPASLPGGLTDGAPEAAPADADDLPPAVASAPAEPAEAMEFPASGIAARDADPADEAVDGIQAGLAQEKQQAGPSDIEVIAARAETEAAARPDSSAGSLVKEIAAALGDDAGAPQIAAEATAEGTLLSLTDDVSFAMFAIGSAEPQPETIRVMEKVAAVLSQHEGRIVIRGHTDARPFKSGTYDNWRLSTDRAHMAYYMLVRGGLDPERVERIEGYADRRLKLPDNPEADENRRIEILIQDEAG